MHFLPLLRKRLKDDDVIDILEWAKTEVVYDFDRLHENQPDKYWVTAKNCGFQLGFNDQQILDVIFLHVAPSEEFSACDPENCDVPFFLTSAEVGAHGSRQDVQIVKGKTTFLNVEREWVRLEYPRHSLHYEFSDGSLALVTISAR